MHMAADMSCRMGWVDRSIVDRTVALMEKAGLPVELPKGGGMDMDKFLNVSSSILSRPPSLDVRSDLQQVSASYLQEE